MQTLQILTLKYFRPSWKETERSTVLYIGTQNKLSQPFPYEDTAVIGTAVRGLEAESLHWQGSWGVGAWETQLGWDGCTSQGSSVFVWECLVLKLLKVYSWHAVPVNILRGGLANFSYLGPGRVPSVSTGVSWFLPGWGYVLMSMRVFGTCPTMVL